jgi:YegS/Rv2252/BmrU family lipid kinase
MKFCFIINPISGRKKDIRLLVDCIQSSFSGYDYSIKYTERANHAEKIAHKAALAAYDVVVAVGGDGTVNEVASGLVGANTALAIIPRGSGNGFARTFKIPLKSKAAIDLIKNPTFQYSDVAQINKRYFFGIAGMGLEANVSAAFQRYAQRGALPYFYLTLKNYLQFKPEQYKIYIDGGSPIEVEPLSLTIANTNQFGNDAYIAPQANWKDGLLDICIIKRMNAVQGLQTVYKLFNQTINTSANYLSLRGKKIRIEHRAHLHYHRDGEPFLSDGIIDISVSEFKLKVCAPI